MAELSAREIAKLISDEGKRNGKNIPVAKIALFTAIVLAESGGNTNAVCFNYDRAGGIPDCSKNPLPPGTPGTERGVDRGLWQWNSRWNDIKDEDAYDPIKSTAYAYVKSQGFTVTSPMWDGSKGLTPQAQKDALAAIADFDSVDVGAIFDKVTPDFLTDPLQAVGKLIGYLVDPAFWMRALKIIGGMIVIAMGTVMIGSELTPMGQLSKLGKQASTGVTSAGLNVQ